MKSVFERHTNPFSRYASTLCAFCLYATNIRGALLAVERHINSVKLYFTQNDVTVVALTKFRALDTLPGQTIVSSSSLQPQPRLECVKGDAETSVVPSYILESLTCKVPFTFEVWRCSICVLIASRWDAVSPILIRSRAVFHPGCRVPEILANIARCEERCRKL